MDPDVAKTLSPYGYATDNPLNVEDPSGLFFTDLGTDNSGALGYAQSFIDPCQGKPSGTPGCSPVISGGFILSLVIGFDPFSVGSSFCPGFAVGVAVKTLSKGQLKALQQAGYDPEQEKSEVMGGPSSRYNLYIDKDGYVYVLGKDGVGEGQPTGLRLQGTRVTEAYPPAALEPEAEPEPETPEIPDVP